MTDQRIIAFVCLHGSAKSLIAAEHANRLARERGLALVATTSGPEPDEAVPENVVEGLAKRGIDVRRIVPRRVSAEALRQATQIVAFGCDLAGLVEPQRAVERWDDCPAVSDDFDIAYAFITKRVELLIGRPGGPP
jgi:arsenate reductase (thioredoxin)